MFNKKTLALGLFSIFASVNANAADESSSAFGAVGINVAPETQTFSGVEFDSNPIVFIQGGQTNVWAGLGWYAETGITVNITDENGTSTEPYVDTTILGGGITYAITSDFGVNLGGGYAWSNGAYKTTFLEYETEDENNQGYAKAGAYYVFDNGIRVASEYASVGGVAFSVGTTF